MSHLSFGPLWPLWLLLLLPLMWWASARSRANLSRGHLVAVTLLRSLALIFVVAALLRPAWITAMKEVSVIYALDVSRSVASGFVQSALQFAQKTDREAKPAHSRYVAFAQDARLLDRAEDIRGLAVGDRPEDQEKGVLYQGATNLERALDEALVALDASRIKRVVLFSDGIATEGDLWRMVPLLASQGVRVFPFPAPPRATVDAWIESIDVPPGVRRDEPIDVTVRIVSEQAGPAQVRLSAGNEVLGTRTLTLNAGVNGVTIHTKLRRSGLVSLTAEVHANGDVVSKNDRLEQAVWVGPRPRVLYVERQPEAAKYLRDALVREGIDVEVADAQRVGGKALASTANPTSIANSSSTGRLKPPAFDGYDAVVLSDLAPKDFDAQAMQALQRYVQERGGGLIFAAGENTFGEAGYSNSALEKILPVEFKSQEKRKDLALVICIDRSYSMKGKPIALAKAGARAALDLLEEQHYFGVIAFDSQPHEAVPLQFVRSKRRAEDLIDRIQASGQTNIFAALATAWRMLEKNTSKRKHVILLSDGDTAPADFDRLLKRMEESKITVSTVTLGKTGDPQLMAHIAEMGKGKAYVAEDIEQVPQLFVEDTKNVTRTSLMEEPFRPVVKHQIEALRGVDLPKAPALLGYASTKAKDDAEVFLATESNAPILARWQYGLGRSVVFASDVKNRWATNWLQWNGYGKFWAQLVRDTLRREPEEQVKLQVVRQGNEARIALDLMSERGAWENHLAPRVRVRGPRGDVEDLNLRQIGPGQYAASIPVTTAGTSPYSFELVAGAGISAQMARRAGMRQLFYAYPDEYRSFPPDVALLRAIATQTGGKLGASVQEIFDPRDDHGTARRTLWPWLAAAGLLCYLLDLMLRRAPFARRLFGG
ncbi:MAG TPA: VWA domain-containing protein [Burkholderiales bacterium]|nr:VWA domain-containing protein [Burkholderiales bacterium]